MKIISQTLSCTSLLSSRAKEKELKILANLLAFEPKLNHDVLNVPCNRSTSGGQIFQSLCLLHSNYCHQVCQTLIKINQKILLTILLSQHSRFLQFLSPLYEAVFEAKPAVPWLSYINLLIWRQMSIFFCPFCLKVQVVVSWPHMATCSLQTKHPTLLSIHLFFQPCSL